MHMPSLDLVGSRINERKRSMSHSWRHSPYAGMPTTESEEKQKEMVHRRDRRRAKLALRAALHDDVSPHWIDSQHDDANLACLERKTD